MYVGDFSDIRCQLEKDGGGMKEQVKIYIVNELIDIWGWLTWNINGRSIHGATTGWAQHEHGRKSIGGLSIRYGKVVLQRNRFITKQRLG